ncbi:MAG: 4Fe-4S cluster-binding domain-containing protein [Candidatus Pacearchaeota archaeon]
MKVKKTKYESYCLKDFDVAKGCKLCVAGKKLVLFITGLCSRNCFYCSLSDKRKNKNKVWANERRCRSVEDAILEAKESKAEGAGITGGDPLVVMRRTLKYARALKKAFGKKFHIHIYVPTDKVNFKVLEKLHQHIDEIRFHPYFLIENIEKEIEKIKLANAFWKKSQIGIEMPLLPDHVREITTFIKKASPYIDFVNLNELEISDTNFDYITTHYKLDSNGYTVKSSIEAGMKVLKACKNLGLKIHLCTAKTKNFFQYKNRLKLRKILPFSVRTEEGTIRLFAMYGNIEKLIEKLKKHKKSYASRKNIYIDKRHKRIILHEKIVPELLKAGFKIARVEELPTYDATMLEFEYL